MPSGKTGPGPHPKGGTPKPATAEEIQIAKEFFRPTFETDGADFGRWLNMRLLERQGEALELKRDLKPCPFCGEDHRKLEIQHSSDGETWFCVCTHCPFDGPAGDDPRVAFELWNMRRWKEIDNG